MARTECTFISLRRTRYSDTKSIIQVYSREQGAMSLLAADGSSRTAIRQRALLMPPSLVCGMVDMKPGREIHPLSNISAPRPLASLHAHPAKSMVAMFLADVLSALLRQSQPDPITFDYIASALQALDGETNPRAVANFHIAFLIGLTHCLGVAPDVSTWHQGTLFDMRNGVFRSTPPLHADWLDADESRAAHTLLRITLHNHRHYIFSRAQRLHALETILRYLSIHLTPLAPRSLDILRSLS